MGDWKVVEPVATTNKMLNPAAEGDAPFGPELIVNGGFETAGGGGADVFGTWVENAGGGAIVDNVANQYAGAHCCEMTGSLADNTYVYQDITVEAETWYRFSVQLDSNGNTAQFRIYDNTGAADILAKRNLGTCLNYEEHDFAFFTPAACVSVRVYLYPVGNPSTSYFDEVSVRKCTFGELSTGAATHPNAIARSTTYQFFGRYSYHLETAADNEGAVFILDTLANAIHYVTMFVRGTLPAAWDWSLDNGTYTAPTLLQAFGDNWSLYGIQFPAVQANGSQALWVRQNGAGAGDFYIGGIQVEELELWTLYCDGDRPGCAWTGRAYQSPSTRSGESRAGGYLRDLKDDFGWGVAEVTGIGAAPLDVNVDEYSLLPGGQLNSIRARPREFDLVGPLIRSGSKTLSQRRHDLLRLMQYNRYPETDEGWQPVRIFYMDAEVPVYVDAHYEQGLEARWDLVATNRKTIERLAVRFVAPFPYLRAFADTTVDLDSSDSASFKYVLSRLKSSGQWDPLGTPAAVGAPVQVRAIVEGPDKKIYVGGDFTTWDGIAGADYIARYDLVAETWELVGAASAFSDVVRALVVGPDGLIYAGGLFDKAGGAVANFVAVYDWTTDTWAELADDPGAGHTGVYCLAFDRTGLLLAGGAFTDIGGVVGADDFASFDGTTWAIVGAGADGTGSVFGVAVDLKNDYYIVGQFLNWGGDADADRLAVYSQADDDWTSVDGVTPNGICYSICCDARGVIYFGGNFTDVDSIAGADYVAGWDGVKFFELDGGTDGIVYAMGVGPDGLLYIVGLFTTAGSLTVPDRMAKWNGGAWGPLDFNLTAGAPTLYAVGFGAQDPVVPANYDLFFGGDYNNTCTYDGMATVQNDGIQAVYPKVHVERSGGTSATVISIRSHTMGRELLSGYALQDGERLTLHLEPGKQQVVSSFYGQRLDALLAGYSFAGFELRVGSNQVSCFVATAGSPTVTAWLEWQDIYDGV